MFTCVGRDVANRSNVRNTNRTNEVVEANVELHSCVVEFALLVDHSVIDRSVDVYLGLQIQVLAQSPW